MSAPFIFGSSAGAGFDFGTAEMAGPVDQSQKIMDLEVENGILQCKLDAALAHVQVLGNEHAEAQELAKNATMEEDDYEHIRRLQAKVEEHEGTIKEQRESLNSANERVSTTEKQLDDLAKDVNTHKDQAQQLREASDVLKGKLADQSALTDEVERNLTDTYAELEKVRRERNNIIKARDNLDAENEDLKLQFRGLSEQWQQAQERIGELEAQQSELTALAKSVEDLEGDLERLQAIINEHNRTILVKDERISHLETQYQKERTRNLNNADAAALAATTSPIDEAPPSLPSLGDNLQDELDAASDEYDDFAYEHLELSDITDVVDIAPIEPLRPNFTIDVEEAGSVTPVARKTTTTDTAAQTDAPDVQTLTTKLLDAATIDISPVAPRRATTTTFGTQTETPKLSTQVVDAAAIATSPIEIATHKLSTRIIDDAAFGFSPVEPQYKPTTSSEQTMNFGDIQVVLDEQPIDPRSAASPSTTSTAAQTTETTQTTENATTARREPIIVTPTRNKISLLQAILPFATLLLAITCLHLYIQLDSWRYANGVGYKFSNTGRTGAFGSGHNLFGFIPIATDMDAPWWEVQLSRYLRVMTKGFEDWAGIDTRPLY